MATQFGEDHGLIHEVVVTGRRVGAGREFYSRLAHDESLFRRTVQFVMGVICLVLKVVVDYNRSLAEMISAGRYHSVIGGMTEYFSVNGEGKQEKEVVLFNFGRTILGDDAIREMDVVGYRPAVIEDLLALGESQPELQNRFSIIALGSIGEDQFGNCIVPWLRKVRYRGRRHLDIGYLKEDWDDSCRFLAVPK
jgi:hypothetical protein